MRRIVVLGCLVALAVPASGGAAGGRDVRAIRGLLKQQLTLLKQGKFRQSYTLTTPSFRSHCPYPRFLRQAREARRRLGPSAQLDRVRVDFKTRRRALVEYRVLKNGKLFMWVRFSRGDRYAKLGTRWFDDYDQLKC